MHGLVDLQAFKTATAHPVFKKMRGANIEKLDHLLGQWESRVVRTNVEAQVALLAALIQECKHWLRLKARTKRAPGATDATMFARRFRAIKQLAHDALQTLLHLDPELYRAHTAFEARKQVHRGTIVGMGMAPTRGMGTAGLAGGYANERRAFERSLKTDAISASRMTAWVGGTAAPSFLSRGERKKWFDVLRGKSFDDLSEADFITIGDFLKREGANAHVTYYSKLERLQDMLRVWFDQTGHAVLVDYHDQKVHGSMMYAIDEYGNVFARDATHQGSFNHSSFNAGKNVICAGTLACDRGHLTEIDNTSGHYRPGRENLRNAVVVLLDVLELDLSRCVVTCYVAAGEKVDAGGGQWLKPFQVLTWRAGHARNFANGGQPDSTARTFLA